MKKVISILLCYCILILPAGCRSSRLLTTDEAETMKGAQNYLLIHTPTRTFKIYNYKFINDSIEGDLLINSPTNAHTISLYTNLNLDIKTNIRSSKFIRLSKSDITKITYSEFSIENTLLLTVGIFGILAILAVIVGNSMSFNIDVSGLGE